MFLVKRKNGIYYVIFKNRDGKRTSITTNTDNKVRAERFIRNFSLPEAKASKPKPLMLREFVKQYLMNIETSIGKSTYRDYKASLKFVRLYFGDTFDVRELTPGRIQEYVNHRIRYYSHPQARKDLITLKTAFNKMCMWEFINFNPAAKIKRLRSTEKLPLFYSETDIEALLSKVDDDDLKDLIVTALNTGMRQGELISLTWDEIQLQTRTIVLTNREHITKSRRIRSIPMNSAVFEIMQRRSFCSRKLSLPT